MAYSDIKDPSAHFQVKKWTGNAGTNAITLDGNSDMRPDFMWHKEQNDTNGWHQFDSSRGAAKYLATQSTAAEGTYSGYLNSFDSNGFTAGAGDSSMNSSGTAQCSWMWHCNGGTTVSNTDGDITSTVQVNQDAGFSIITYTGSGTTNDTIGHGLGEEPDIAIFKRLDAYGNWDVQENSGKSGPVSVAFRHTLNLTEGIATNVLSSFSNTTIGLSTGGDAQKNISGSDYVCYAFKGKQGYSKFGTYYGNGSTDGKFVYLGFKPALIIFKVLSDPNHGWSMIDNTRSPFNLMDDNLFANASTAEVTNSNLVDFLSNGFKLRGSTYPANSGGTNSFSYFAWAENPFVTSTGVPTTAR